MKVEEIRQDSYVEEYLRLHVIDVRNLLAHKSDFVEVPCPACDGGDNVRRFDKSDFRFVECCACETLFINPRPQAPLLVDFYRSAHSFALFNDKIFPESENARREFIFAPRAKKVVELCQSHLAKQPTVLLEVGAGFGTFGEELKKLNYFRRVIAVEPSHDLARTCRKRGIEVIENSIEEADVTSVDVIVCFELIEHLFSPKDFLIACAKRIVGKGLLILTTPNIKGFDLQLLGPLSENIDGPEHINYFHPKSLQGLIERCGFEALEILTPGKLDAELVRKKALAGQINLTPQPFLKHLLLDKWDDLGDSFQKFLADSRLSSHMWLVAQKKSEF